MKTKLRFLTQKFVSEGQLKALTTHCFGLGSYQVTTGAFSYEVEVENDSSMSTPWHSGVRINKCPNDWLELIMILDESVEHTLLDTAKYLAEEIQANVFWDLPENEWADGFWLMAKPNGTVFISFIDDATGQVDESQTRLYAFGEKTLDNAAHCGYCGIRYPDKAWPRVCGNCKNIKWRNPLPVTVVRCVVVDPNNNRGVVCIRRSIPPHIDELALPGGYLDVMDASWEEGAAREFFEETGTKLDPKNLILDQVITSPTNGNLLIFCSAFIFAEQLAKFVPNTEVSELVVAWGPLELCFPTHTEALERFFNG